MRLAVHWLEHTLLGMVPDDGYEDVVDWLEGRDDELAERRRRRDLDAVILAGGEVG